MGASSNFGNMFSVLGASIFLPFLPMAPIQVLTNNLLYDFSQTPIPTDNVDDDYIAAPRRWDISNIFKFMVFIGPISSIFDYVTYGMMIYVFGAWTNPVAVSNRLVCRISSDADAHHSHHSHRQDSLYRKQGECGADWHHDRDLHYRRDAAVHLGRRRARLYAAAAALLAAGRVHPDELCGSDAPDQTVVCAPLGNVSRSERWNRPAPYKGSQPGRVSFHDMQQRDFLVRVMPSGSAADFAA